MGVARLSLFGSTARGDQRSDSDVDVAATLDPEAKVGPAEFFAIEERLQGVLGVPVDFVTEPARRPRFQQQIDKDRIHVF